MLVKNMVSTVFGKKLLIYAVLELLSSNLYWKSCTFIDGKYIYFGES